MDLLNNQNIILYIVTYLLAGVPFGYLLAKQFAGVDIKKEGSGNIGATNVMRVVKQTNPKLAKKLSYTTFFLDAIKGVLMIVIAQLLDAPVAVQWTLAVLAVMGHCFSPFLAFEGGKGVATGFGVIFYLIPIPAAIAISLWFIVAKVLKISLLSALTGVYSLLILSYVMYPELPGIGSHAPLWVIAVIITYKHLPNLIALFQKKETIS